MILGAGPGLHDDPDYHRVADRVTVHGAVPGRAEYEAIIAGCDIVISTTDHEFFGIALLEAALAGVLPFCHAPIPTLRGCPAPTSTRRAM